MSTIVDELITLLGLKVDPKATRDASVFGKILGGVATAALAVGGALAAAAAAVQGYAMGQADNIAETKRFADMLDLSYEGLQRLDYAAKASGGSAAELRGDLEKLTKSMSSPIPGEYNQTLYMLGISARDASGKMRGADEVLLSIADKLQGMTKQRQIQFAERLGLSQTSLRLIQSGRAGMAALGREAESLGIVLDSKTGDQALKFKLTLTRLQATFQGLGTAITAGLLPALESGAKWLSEWVLANRKIISSGVQQLIEGVGRGFGMIADALGLVWGWVQKIIGPMVGFNKALDATQAIAVAVAIALAGLSVAVASAAVPYLAVAAAVAAFVVILEDLYTYLNGGESVIGGWIDSFKAAYPELAGLLGSLGALFAGLVSLIGDGLVGAFKLAWPVLKSMLSGWISLQTTLLNGWEKLVSLIKGVPEFFSKVADFLAPGLTASAGAVASGVPGSVVAGAARSNAGSNGVTVGQLNINGAGDPMAVGNEAARALGLGASVQSIAPGMLGPNGW